MPATLWPKLMPMLLLLASNVFMTFAWYGHLKHKAIALPAVILVGWMIALPEHALAAPANRIGSAVWSTAQLKTMQEVITLLVFVAFSVFYPGEPLKWTTLVGFAFIAAGAGFVFVGR